MKRAFMITRISAEDQLKHYEPYNQWYEDIIPKHHCWGLR